MTFPRTLDEAKAQHETGLYFWTHNMATGRVQCSTRQTDVTPVWSERFRAWTDDEQPKGQLSLPGVE